MPFLTMEKDGIGWINWNNLKINYDKFKFIERKLSYTSGLLNAKSSPKVEKLKLTYN